MKIFLFDIDDTLYDLEHPFKLAFSSIFGENLYNYSIFLDFRKYTNINYDKALNGEITMVDMCRFRSVNAFKDHGIFINNDEADEFQLCYESFRKDLHLDKYMENTLKFLKDSGYPLGIISNGPHFDQFEKLKHLDIFRYIPRENIFISEDVGFHKPSRGIFDYAKKKMIENTSKENEYKKNQYEFFYIGDSYENDILGSKKANFKNIWIDRRSYSKLGKYGFYDELAKSYKEVFDIIKNIITQKHNK